MKNPFEKNNHKVLTTVVLTASIVAGATAYLLLTETGASIRKQLTARLNRMRKNFSNGKPENKHALDYLHHSKKKTKTDRDALLKHEILSAERHD